MSDNENPRATGEAVAWDRERLLVILSEVVARWSMAGDDYRGRQEAYAWGVNALTLAHPAPRGRVAEPYTPSRRALRAWQVSSEELRKLHYCRMMDERYLALVDAESCNHEWKDMRNAVIESGEVCLACGKIRAGNADTGDA